jgi:hypothetical protein
MASYPEEPWSRSARSVNVLQFSRQPLKLQQSSGCVTYSGIENSRIELVSHRNNLAKNCSGDCLMIFHVACPTRILAAGEPPKVIEEFFGRVNSGTGAVSVARMKSPAGWSEPGQTPEFDEYTVVLAGTLRVESRDGMLDVAAGEGVITRAGDWVRYSTPHENGAEYIAVCVPAFSPDTVHRDTQ